MRVLEDGSGRNERLKPAGGTSYQPALRELSFPFRTPGHVKPSGHLILKSIHGRPPPRQTDVRIPEELTGSLPMPLHYICSPWSQVNSPLSYFPNLHWP